VAISQNFGPSVCPTFSEKADARDLGLMTLFWGKSVFAVYFSNAFRSRIDPLMILQSADGVSFRKECLQHLQRRFRFL